MAAKVDSYVITNQDVSRSMAQQSSSGGLEHSSAAKRKVLESLINQQLAVSKAEDQRLDRKPEIMNALDATRREALARAYLEQAAHNLPKPSAEDIHSYFLDHPELFAQRRIYRLNELTVAGPPELVEQLDTLADSGASYAQIVTWLRTRHVRFNAEATALPAESLPLAYLPRLAQLRAGKTLLMVDDQGVHAAQIIEADLAPITETAAAPSIRRFLDRQNQKQVIEAELVRLREHAHIEYATTSNANDSANITADNDDAAASGSTATNTPGSTGPLAPPLGPKALAVK